MNRIIKITVASFIFVGGLSACGSVTTSINNNHVIYSLKKQTIRTNQLLKICTLPEKSSEFYNADNPGLKCLKGYSEKGYHVATYHYGRILYMIYEHQLKIFNEDKSDSTDRIQQTNKLHIIKSQALENLNLSASSVIRLYDKITDLSKYKLEDRQILSESLEILEKGVTDKKAKKKIENGIRVLSEKLTIK